MKNYYRIMLGRQSMYAKEAHEGNFIGAGWLEDIDLSNQLPDNWREFNKKFIPVFLEKYPDRSRIAAGLACGALYTISKYLKLGDLVLSPNGQGSYYVGEVITDYEYHTNGVLPHRRGVRWYPGLIERSQMSQALKNSTGSAGASADVTQYSEEIEALIANKRPPSIVANDETIEDPSEFALEEHLEEFLIKNWQNTELGGRYDIYEEEGEIVGRQYPSDTGPIDILAISKDKNELLVVELKKGRASDTVVGQIQRYMGFVIEELAAEGQKVRGTIIAFEDDNNIRRALSAANAVAKSIDFYTYKISFKLEKK